jgi:hypothetical protein
MKLRHVLVAVGVSALVALSACEQQTTNPSGPGGYPGNGPGGAGASSSSSSSPMGGGSMSSGSSSSPMR